MSVELEILDPRTDGAEWDRYVDRATDTTPFFSADALALQAADTGTDLHLLVGFVGEEPVGVFPVFAYSKGPLTAAFSPAPKSWSGYLGPARITNDGTKQRKAERRTEEFIDRGLAWIDETLAPVYRSFDVVAIDDVRPFTWNGYDVRPEHTYVVDLDGSPEDLLARFSSDARQNISNADAHEYTVEEGSIADVDRIVDQVRSRYRSQGQPYQMSNHFARSLYRTLPEGALRPYVCRLDGEFVGGLLVVESETTRYRWQGGVKPDVDVDLAINDVLDWHVMADGLETGIDRYDLVGAGVPSINRYKAKFNPRLEVHYTATRGRFGLDLVVSQYRKRTKG